MKVENKIKNTAMAHSSMQPPLSEIRSPVVTIKESFDSFLARFLFFPTQAFLSRLAFRFRFPISFQCDIQFLFYVEWIVCDSYTPSLPPNFILSFHIIYECDEHFLKGRDVNLSHVVLWSMYACICLSVPFLLFVCSSLCQKRSVTHYKCHALPRYIIVLTLLL